MIFMRIRDFPANYTLLLFKITNKRYLRMGSSGSTFVNIGEVGFKIVSSILLGSVTVLLLLFKIIAAAPALFGQFVPRMSAKSTSS